MTPMVLASAYDDTTGGHHSPVTVARLARQSTIFTVWRRAYTGPTPPLSALPFAQLGAIARQSYIDTTIASGVSTAECQVRAQRGVAVSQPAIATVLFGSAAQGGVGGLSLAA